ncbi:MAG: hypothetical protein AAF922_12165 [Pseudomonadota bacterium]
MPDYPVFGLVLQERTQRQPGARGSCALKLSASMCRGKRLADRPNGPALAHEFALDLIVRGAAKPQPD